MPVMTLMRQNRTLDFFTTGDESIESSPVASDFDRLIDREGFFSSVQRKQWILST
jgi:hypothetical protein